MNWEEAGPLATVPVEPGEVLSHYLFRKELRADGTVKAEAVVPFPHESLSVMRHRDLTDAEIWESGEIVAAKQGRTLFGRADFRAEELPSGLEATPVEPPRNHADIIGWPSDRSAQLAQAIRLAGVCKGLMKTGSR